MMSPAKRCRTAMFKTLLRTMHRGRAGASGRKGSVHGLYTHTPLSISMPHMLIILTGSDKKVYTAQPPPLPL